MSRKIEKFDLNKALKYNRESERKLKELKVSLKILQRFFFVLRVSLEKHNMNKKEGITFSMMISV